MRAALSVDEFLPVEPQAIEHNKRDSPAQVTWKSINFIFVWENET